MRAGLVTVTALLAATALAGSQALAQQGRGAGPGRGGTPRTSAFLDLTGQWVSVVNEDWRWRMVTPPRGDTASSAR